ncbi:hypothetical protein [Nocardioides pinisoli]|uniref:Uncharacterized protein n=1 Tax=Nocardioides pinisoli TaxID=2950279 RepID=A0ABT1L0G6_9ACTN|nr:hypothetical protein [Nocardioides pinisoli]MCP3422981.1 hypothetical protein [Nocardioides pinisoli]
MDIRLTPGQRAHVDQVLALVNEVEHAWPWNQQLMADAEVERVVLERLGDDWPGLRDDRAYLLWANGRLVDLDDAISEHDITRQVIGSMPLGGECDRCRSVRRIAGAAVIAVPRNLVPLLLCGSCASRLRPDVLITKEATDG